MKESKIENLVSEIKNDLSDLSRKSNDEINKNKNLKQLLTFIKSQIKENKSYLSLLSLLGNKTNNNINKKDIENELIKNNKKLFESNELIKNEISVLKEKYNSSLILLNQSIKQQQNVLETIKETNFILDNKIKEKNSLIDRMKEKKYDLEFKQGNYEIIKGINNDCQEKNEEFNKAINYNLMIEREFYQEYFFYKASKFNKMKNKVYKLSKKKNELESIIKGNIHKNLEIINNISDIVNYNRKEEELIEDKKIKDKFQSDDELQIPTNIATETSFFSLNDSLSFDTEEQIDVELPENDFSSYYLSQKNLGFNIIKKKKLYIPKLELNQIKFNLLKRNNTSKEISLSRPLENEIKLKIKKLKNQIYSFERQNDNLEKKCEKFEKKIKEIALLVYSKPLMK